MNGKYALTFFFTALTSLHGPAALAQDVGQHPAVFAPRKLPGIDPSTFIVAHPAQPSLVAGHANHAHPAVVAKSAAPTIDTDGYLVQPPASTHWTLGVAVPAATTAVAPAATVVR